MQLRTLLSLSLLTVSAATAAAQDAITVPIDVAPAPAKGPKMYGSIDYLLFNFRDGPCPPVIQHVPTNRFQVNLDPDAAQTIYGDGIRHHAFSGLHLNAGAWFTDTFGVDGSFTGFETKSKNFFIESNGEPSIGRFYTDVTNSSRPLTYLVYSDPDGSQSGSVLVTSPVRFWHADVNARTNGYSVFADRTDWLVGFRYADLRDGIYVRDFTQRNDATRASLTGEDNFSATNQFYGGQVGFNSWYELGCGFTMDVTGKFAVGGLRRQAVIDGFTTERRNGVVVRTVPGDVLTQPTNIGSYSETHISIMPELMVKLGYQILPGVNVSVGYDIIAITGVTRAGSVIDYGVNPAVNPYLTASAQSDARRPEFNFGGTDFWAQGMTLGVTFTY